MRGEQMQSSEVRECEATEQLKGNKRNKKMTTRRAQQIRQIGRRKPQKVGDARQLVAILGYCLQMMRRLARLDNCPRHSYMSKKLFSSDLIKVMTLNLWGLNPVYF